MWKGFTLSIHFGPVRTKSFGAINETNHWIERSSRMEVSKEVQGRQEIPEIDTNDDRDADEDEDAEIVRRSLIWGPTDLHLRNRRVHLRLLIAAFLTACLAGTVFLTQGHSLGLEDVAVKRIGFTVVACAAAGLFIGLFRLLPHRTTKEPNRKKAGDQLLDRIEKTRKVDVRLYVIATIVTLFAIFVGAVTVAVGALVVIFTNRSSTGLTVSVIGATAGALSLYFRTTLNIHHRVLLQRYGHSDTPKRKASPPRKSQAAN